MKKTIVSLLMCLWAVSSLAANDEQPIPFQALEISSETGNTHRGVFEIPIRAYYDGSSEIRMSFVYDIGDVTILITNTSSGVSYEYVADSSNGFESFQIENNSGYYIVVVLPSDGSGYAGYFEIID